MLCIFVLLSCVTSSLMENISQRLISLLGEKEMFIDPTTHDPLQPERYQRFKRLRTGRFVPIFSSPRGLCSTVAGFQAAKLLVECLSGNYELWNEEDNLPMQTDGWTRGTFSTESKLPIRCLTCDTLTRTASHKSMKAGQGVACKCQPAPWRERRTEFAQFCKARGLTLLTPEAVWKQHASSSYKPSIRCVCGNEVHRSTVGNVLSGHAIGCSICVATCNLWKDRYDDFATCIQGRSFTLLTTRDEWRASCSNSKWCPTVRCKHGNAVSNTCINNILSDHDPECPTCKSERQRAHNEHNMWRHKYDEFESLCASREVCLLMSREEWLAEASDVYKPRFRCLRHDIVVTSTSVGSFLTGRFGCGRCFGLKTANKLAEWLGDAFPDAHIDMEVSGPPSVASEKPTRFDFRLCFPDGVCVLLELDGPQHFWKSTRWFSETLTLNDRVKEEYAIHVLRVSLVRVLQRDVWDDVKEWQAWILSSTASARAIQAPRLFVPDRAEYTSPDSMYVSAHNTTFDGTLNSDLHL